MADEILAIGPVLRFAPSPNGALHLGHAYSALMNERLAAEINGRVLLRIEDLDRTRCKPQFEAAIVDDLAWLGLRFPASPRRQSEHANDYAAALARLDRQGLVYPCFCSRADIARASNGSATQIAPRSIPEPAAHSLRQKHALASPEVNVRPFASTCGVRSTPDRRVSAGPNLARAPFPRSIPRPRRFGATLSSAGAIWRRATIWRWWSMTRFRA
jgi:glutamyl/glutaminyl-tRNA synthetase